MKNRSEAFLKRLLTPVTILMVPHAGEKPVSIRVPALAVLASVFLFLAGTSYVLSVAVHAAEYRRMQERVSYLSSRFREMEHVVISLRQAERDFRKLFGLKSKTAVLESEDLPDSGSFDLETLRGRIDGAMRSVADIRTYLRDQRDLYRATPSGPPAPGPVSSSYGIRRHPVSEESRLHTGVDISVPAGTEVKATADGIVSFAGWTENGGTVVVLEHGRGFRTAYAHNREATVRVGQRVARRETIAFSGSTGLSTGPHVHYEVWRNGRPADPAGYLGE
ncbi:MAG: M23 family metallopeptidase [Thermodesulfobacteriota bacterium]